MCSQSQLQRPRRKFETSRPVNTCRKARVRVLLDRVRITYAQQAMLIFICLSIFAHLDEVILTIIIS